MSITITREQLDEVMEIIYDNVQEDVDLREDYSGRGMFGDTCVGITSDSDISPLVGIALADVLGADDAIRIVRNTRSDSMGMGMIVYFPYLQVEGNEEG